MQTLQGSQFEVDVAAEKVSIPELLQFVAVAGVRAEQVIPAIKLDRRPECRHRNVLRQQVAHEFLPLFLQRRGKKIARQIAKIARLDARIDIPLHGTDKKARLAHFELEALKNRGRLRIQLDRPGQPDFAETVETNVDVAVTPATGITNAPLLEEAHVAATNEPGVIACSCSRNRADTWRQQKLRTVLCVS